MSYEQKSKLLKRVDYIVISGTITGVIKGDTMAHMVVGLRRVEGLLHNLFRGSCYASK